MTVVAAEPARERISGRPRADAQEDGCVAAGARKGAHGELRSGVGLPDLPEARDPLQLTIPLHLPESRDARYSDTAEPRELAPMGFGVSSS